MRSIETHVVLHDFQTFKRFSAFGIEVECISGFLVLFDCSEVRSGFFCFVVLSLASLMHIGKRRTVMLLEFFFHKYHEL